MFIKQSSSRQLIFNIIERLSVSSWQKDLEVLHRIIGLINKVQLCLYGKFLKSRCIVIYLFARWFITNRKKMGWLRVSLYLKSCSVCLMKAYGGTFNKHEPLSHPVSLTGSGLPRCIPSFHRHEILRREDQSDQLVQLYLSLFSISKLILRVKSTSKMYKTIVDPPAVSTIWPDMDCVPDLMTRYCPQAFDIPMSLGLKVDLSWFSSPVSVTWLFRDKKARSPLHRLIWEFFAISPIDSIERVSRSIYLTPKNFIPSDPVKSVFGILSDWWPIGARCQSFLSMFFI